MGISPDNGVQTNFIDYDAERHEKMKRLDEALDKINREYGSETIVLGSQQYMNKEVMGKAAIEREQSQAGLDSAEREQARTKSKYVCSICGYVYDPAEHDGVAFEDLPDDWRCPRCKQPREIFNQA